MWSFKTIVLRCFLYFLFLSVSSSTRYGVMLHNRSLEVFLNALPIRLFGQLLYVMARRLPGSFVGECSGVLGICVWCIGL